MAAAAHATHVMWLGQLYELILPGLEDWRCGSTAQPVIPSMRGGAEHLSERHSRHGISHIESESKTEPSDVSVVVATLAPSRAGLPGSRSDASVGFEQYRDMIESHVEEQRGRLIEFGRDRFVLRFDFYASALNAATEILFYILEDNAESDSIARPDVRIGVHTGKESEDLVGTAERIMHRSEPTRVAITREVFDSINGIFDLGFEPLDNATSPDGDEKITEGYLVLMPWQEDVPESRKLPVPPTNHFSTVVAVILAVLVGIAFSAWQQ